MRPEVPPEVLYPRRLAARALAMVLERYGLGQMALKFNPDDPTQAFPGAMHGEVRFYEDRERGQRPLAVVVLADSSARVYVERVRDLVRRAHRKTFRPAEVGIASMLDVEVDISGIVELEGERLRTAPQRSITRRLSRGRPQVIHAISALRGR
jgi:hypothetical protein